ncbi:DUF6464 family protein [Nostoc sp.]|uniref:DUF6464 family protein n=1 Tax=Nostoc sp. TaxID=1180 RepID=UPI003FA55D80
MNQIERVGEDNYTLRLWSDAMYEVSTIAIKNLLNLVTQRLEIQLEIDAHYHHIIRNWRVRFSWCLEPSGRQRFEQNLDHSQLVCANAMFLERLAHDISDRIRRTVSNNDSQNWVIVRYRDGHLAGIHQAGKTSVSLILYEVTQDGDLAANQTRVTIRAWTPGNAIRRGDSVEIDGMLLQGELLGWFEEAGQESWFLFSPNTHQVNTSQSSSDEARITFSTHPKTNRLAYFERVSRMIADGQIEILRSRSEFFGQYLNALPRIGGSMEFRWQRESPPSETERHIASLEFGYFAIPSDTGAITRSADTIGDRTCKYNALSRMLRCAVNPCGPCEGCTHYEKL